MANAAADGTFDDILFDTWNDNFVPRGFNDQGGQQTIIGYIDNTEHYGNSCGAIALEIDFIERTVELFFIPQGDGAIAAMNSDALIDGDSFLSLNYNAAGWGRFIENMGTFAVLRQRVLDGAGGQNGGRRRYRKTRKSLKKKSKRHSKSRRLSKKY